MDYSPNNPDRGSGDIETLGSQSQGVPAPEEEMMVVPSPEKAGGCVIYINSGVIGGGDHPHGSGLMNNFLYTLTETAPQPNAIILVGSAVKLAQAGSSAIESLALMQEQGVQILVAEKSLAEIAGNVTIAVGKPVTMHAILNTLLRAEKVISL